MQNRRRKESRTQCLVDVQNITPGFRDGRTESICSSGEDHFGEDQRRERKEMERPQGSNLHVTCRYLNSLQKYVANISLKQNSCNQNGVRKERVVFPDIKCRILSKSPTSIFPSLLSRWPVNSTPILHLEAHEFSAVLFPILGGSFSRKKSVQTGSI